MVTSPPYWGLRSYKTEAQVWGGDIDCSHEWAGNQRLVETTVKGGNWQQANNGQGMACGKLWTRFRGDTEAAAASKTYQLAGSDACKKCRAWRGELGLEPSPGLYVEHLVEVFREVRRVLKPDGTLFLNLGDCYATGAGKVGGHPGGGGQGARWREMNPGLSGARAQVPDRKNPHAGVPTWQPNRMPLPGLKPKDLVGLPWRAAFALQADGWYLRSDIIWHKPNPMPESVRDRPTRSHEYVFLLTKSRRYFYDARAIAEPLTSGPSDLRKMAQGLPRIGGKHLVAQDPHLAASVRTNIGRRRSVGPRFSSGNIRRDIPTFSDGRGIPNDHRGRSVPWENTTGLRNARSVWTIATQPFRGAHFATFPAELVRRCILAGCPPGGVVLDPFIGSGTTAEVALKLGRRFIGIDLNADYVAMAKSRVAPLLDA